MSLPKLLYVFEAPADPAFGDENRADDGELYAARTFEEHADANCDVVVAVYVLRETGVVSTAPVFKSTGK